MKKHKAVFDAFDAYDKGTYKRSMLVDCRPKGVKEKVK